VFIRKNKLTYLFNKSGLIEKIFDEANLPLRTYTYSVDEVSFPKIDRITNAVGQSVQLTRGANKRVSKVTDPAGNAWLYEYNVNGMLSKVTSPDATLDLREYHYENADPTLLTGISIGGKRYSTYTYYRTGAFRRAGWQATRRRTASSTATRPPR
jgi:YD repeat-containing protein